MKGKEKLGRIWEFVRSYKITFCTLFFCVVVTSFIGMLYPYIFSILIDEVFYHRNIKFFKIIVLSYGVLYVGEACLHLILNSVWAYLMTRFLFDIRRKIFEKILKLKASYLNNSRTGDLIARINTDVWEFMNFIHWNVFYVSANILRLLLAIIFVLIINFKLAILMIIAVPIRVYLSKYFGKKAKVQFKNYRDEYGKNISWVTEILKGIREIHLFAGEKNVTRKFAKNSASLIYLKIKASLVELMSERANAFISLITDLSLYVLAGVFIVRGDLTIGGFIAAIDYFSKSNGILNNLNEANIRIQNNMVSIDKVFNLLDEEIEEENIQKRNWKIMKGEISFQNVLFYYDEEKPVLKNINLQANPGEKISLVGKSGAGKSTLINMLLRFYDPIMGEIKIDDVNIKDCSLKDLRRNIGIVQQEAILFEGTIKYNLKLGKPKCTEEEMWEACEKANIADFLRSLPDGLNTVIGTSGMNLSGGQKQRVAIARIFLKNPKILIFDEATSALDYETEVAIKKAWKELSVGRTSIIIAHRLSTILDSDRVAVLHDGEIVSFDHHNTLLKTCDYYRQLFEEQYLKQEEIAL